METSVRAADGLPLFRRTWQPAEPSRLLVLVHGLAEHSDRYQRMGTWFALRGCAVHAYDQRGHGLSGGRRAHVARFDDFVSDLSGILELAQSEHPDLPCTLVGHSMGGLVATAFALRRRPSIAGLITSGALLDLPPTLSLPRRLVLQLLSKVAPRVETPLDIDPQWLSRDPDVARKYREDPRVFTKITCSLGAALIEGVRSVEHRGADLELPVLMLHGGDDRLCPPAGSESFFAQLRDGHALGSELRVYPELRHEIFNEPEAETLFEEMLVWLQSGEADARSARRDEPREKLQRHE